MSALYACTDDATTDGETSGCPPETICGSGGNGSSTGSKGSGTMNTGTGGCQENWQCGPWETNGTDDNGHRECVDLNACGTTAQKPVSDAMLPALDLNYYKCKVEPILDQKCSMMGCHGSNTRGLRTFSRGRLRNPGDMLLVTGCSNPGSYVDAKTCIGSIECACFTAPHSANEWRKNYDSARGFALDITGQPNGDQENSELIQQPKEGTGKAHAGYKLFKDTDPEHATLKAWLDATPLASCNTTN